MRLFLILIIISLSAFAALSQTSLKPGSPAPVFTSQSIDGNFFDLESKRGSIVVLTFWSTTCQICREEIPRLNQFTSRYVDKDVIFIALTMENEDRVAPFLRKNPFNFTIMPNSLGALLQYADRDRGGNLDMGFPSFFVIDQDGKLDYRSSGYGGSAALGQAIDRLILGKRTE
ncbi:MAG: TlpA family protein disulfide reductase [Pyrinomonadaceae bacterium]|nr:TlpA family protein disulfide reductase [Acidobacteriota bacterium]MBK7932887.1 TlpA family protein disulfide reductase [Acidobacteriota bacterium]MBP7375470.1 TlpA family protein disulfide reductase [Pyrinomonadaceae bacterium]